MMHCVCVCVCWPVRSTQRASARVFFCWVGVNTKKHTIQNALMKLHILSGLIERHFETNLIKARIYFDCKINPFA